MDLSTLRVKVRDITGRYDLVDSGGNDSGMDYWINRGIRHLDLNYGHLNGVASRLVNISAGEYEVLMRDFRWAKAVWVVDSSGDKTRLTRVEFDDLLAAYPEDPDGIDQGEPAWYAYRPLGLAPQQDGETDLTDTYEGAELIETGDHYANSGIAFMPPADEAYTLHIRGMFFSATLTNDSDMNFWTVRYSDLAAFATALKLEQAFRNSAGARDWQAAIDREVFGLQKDQVELELSDLDMEIGG